jgi:hypothetical protein
MSNPVNSDLLTDFYQHIKNDGTSENYQKGKLRAMVHFADHLGPVISFYDVNRQEQVIYQLLRCKDKE